MQLLRELIKNLKFFNFTLFPRRYYADRYRYTEHTFVRCKLLRWNRNRVFRTGQRVVTSRMVECFFFFWTFERSETIKKTRRKIYFPTASVVFGGFDNDFRANVTRMVYLGDACHVIIPRRSHVGWPVFEFWFVLLRPRSIFITNENRLPPAMYAYRRRWKTPKWGRQMPSSSEFSLLVSRFINIVEKSVFWKPLGFSIIRRRLYRFHLILGEERACSYSI